MCGIAGIAGHCEDPTLLSFMIKRMKHRGPDAEGYYRDGKIQLGHCRLSIKDLSEKAKQPFVSADNNMAVVVNGEIYNFEELKKTLIDKGYKFQSESDCEVILHAYIDGGLDFVSKLNGMFAIGIWDGAKRSLFLIRDRLGIKPLYYSVNQKIFLFASEIKSIALCKEVKLSLDLQSLSEYLAFENIFSNRTLNERVKMVEPGEIVKYTVKLENKEVSSLKVNDLTIKIPTYVRATTWSKHLTKVDEKTFSYTGTISSESSTDFIVNVKSMRIGEYTITTTTDLDVLKNDFKDEVSEKFGVGISDIIPELTIPETVKAGNSFDIKLKLTNKAKKSVLGIYATIESDLFDPIEINNQAIKSGGSKTITKNIVVPQIDQEQESTITLKGSYGETTFETQDTIKIEPIPKVISVTKTAPDTIKPGEKLTVDISVKNVYSKEVSVDAIEIIPSSIRKDLEGEVIAELILGPNEEKQAYSYSITIPKDQSQSFNLKTSINFELDGDVYKIEELSTVNVEGAQTSDDITEPDDTTKSDDIEETDTGETEEEKQGIFTKFINFFKNLFKKNGETEQDNSGN